ncbi:MAG: oligosaccharide flippase family protein [Solirubrobacterales bacterium]
MNVLKRIKTDSVNSFVDEKFARGVAWNLISFVIMGIAGVLLNVVIARFYPPETLGVFNIFFASYVVISQASVLGLHASVLRHTTLYAADRKTLSTLVTSALVLTAASSGITCAILWLGRNLLGSIFGSPGVSVAFTAGMLGMFFFPINKVLLSHLNGLRRMASFAVGNSSRYLLIIIAVICLYGFKQPGNTLTASFSIAEGFLFVYLIAANWRNLGIGDPGDWGFWVKKHLSFGIRGMFGGILNELNSRIDILVAGLFLDVKTVGIYSFAAFIAMGISQVLNVFRSNYDPIIARLSHEGLLDDLHSMISKGKMTVLKGMLAVAILGIGLYPWIIPRVTGGNEYDSSWLPFAILMFGIWMRSGFTPFEGLLVQSGHPAKQSGLILSVAFVSLVGNLCFIPLWGMVGGALASLVSQVFFIFMLKALVYRVFHRSMI